MDYLLVRLGCSFLSGVLLSQAGSLTQLGTRNILASPSTLGFDGLSVLWLLLFHSVSLYFVSENPVEFIFLAGIPVFCILGLVFSRFFNHRTKLEGIILLGLTFNLLVGAIFSLWQFFFMAFNLQFPVELWFGHFRFSSQYSLALLVLLEIILILALKFYLKRLRLFSIGPFLSQNWAIDEKTILRFVFIAVSVSTLSVVSLFGAFSFLGLVFPIVARKLWFKKFDLTGELFIGALFSGLCLMAVDALCYFYPIYGAEVPVGLIATAVGAVSLILILRASYKDSESLAKPKK